MANPRILAKIESGEPTLRLAVLIDADNAQATSIEGLITEIARYGEATVKRMYGDFTSSESVQWKKILQRYAIKPIQQFAYTTGKNATDSMLIIDAMDLLYTRRFDGFCLISSDSDFTSLAIRIREEGLMVLGFGEQKTPEAFRKACHKFIFTEVLRSVSSVIVDSLPLAKDTRIAEVIPSCPVKSISAQELPKKKSLLANGTRVAEVIPSCPAKSPTILELPKKKFPRQFLLNTLAKACDDTGWAHLGAFGHYIIKIQPDFESRLYGFTKLSDLVKSKPDLFTVEERSSPNSGGKALYIRSNVNLK